MKSKMALFCHVPESHIVDLHDVSNIWHVPLIMQEQGALKAIYKCLEMVPREPDLAAWSARAHKWDSLTSKATVAMVGKYTGLSDAYLSVIKSLEHACIACGHRLDLKWVDAEHLEPTAEKDHPEKFRDAWAVVKCAPKQARTSLALCCVWNRCEKCALLGFSGRGRDAQAGNAAAR